MTVRFFALLLLQVSALSLLASNPFVGAKLEKMDVKTKASFRGLHIPDSKNVWIGGTQGTVIHYNGYKWKVMQVPGAEELDFRDVWGFDGRRAVAMSAGPGEGSRMYQTTNGGKTWREVFKNPFPKGFYDGLTFIDRMTGFAYSDPVAGKLLLVKSTDGGKSWNPVDQKILPPTLKGEASFAASGSGILSLRKTIWISTGGAEKARVFKSEDGGESWTVVDTPMRAGAPAAGIFSMTFSDQRNGVAVGGHYQKPKERQNSAIITRDGGETWTLAKEMPNGYRCGVTYVPGFRNALMAVGTTGTDISTDGGMTWSSFNKTNLNAVKFGPSLMDGWAVGPDGLIMRFVPVLN